MDCAPDNEFISTDDVGEKWFRMDLFGVSLSFVSLSLISLAILSDKRVSSHPNNIIAYIMLCDAYTYCQYLIRYICCGYSLNSGSEWLFGATFVKPYMYVTMEWFGVNYYDKYDQLITW